LLLVEGLPAGRQRLVPCVSNLDDQRCHFGLSATTERDRGFADSLLEGDGFEPSVPGAGMRQAKSARLAVLLDSEPRN
jgi:hypothetical protein